jgi:methyl-accepting chemotaxis protein
MSAISNPEQSEFSQGSLPAKKSLVEKLAIDPVDLKNDRSSERPRLGKRVFLITLFCAGVTTILAWLSYGDALRKEIASSLPRLGWLAPQVTPVGQNTQGIPPVAPVGTSPDQQQLNAMSLELDEMRQSIDRIATNVAAGQEHMTQSLDRIAASQERTARTLDQLATEITKLQAIGQYMLYKNSESPSPRRAAR